MPPAWKDGLGCAGGSHGVSADRRCRNLIHPRSEAMGDVPYNHKYQHDRQQEPQGPAG